MTIRSILCDVVVLWPSTTCLDLKWAMDAVIDFTPVPIFRVNVLLDKAAGVLCRSSANEGLFCKRSKNGEGHIRCKWFRNIVFALAYLLVMVCSYIFVHKTRNNTNATKGKKQHQRAGINCMLMRKNSRALGLANYFTSLKWLPPVRGYLGGMTSRHTTPIGSDPATVGAVQHKQ